MIMKADQGGYSMKWLKPTVREYCVGMEVTSYESAEIDPLV
jgi:coenzyme PQQ precursor peptide PqqA